MIRCGGSLLARLFDGHPSVMSMPIEMSYSSRKVFWDDLDDLCGSRDFHGLVTQLNLERSFEKLARKGWITKDIYGKGNIQFDYQAFIDDLCDLLGEQASLTPHVAVDCIYDSFFKHWDDGIHNPGLGVKATVNHLSMMCFADPLTFKEYFKPGLIVHPVRDPRAWYSSMKRLFKVENNQRVFLPVSILLWAESTIRALVHSRFFGSFYRLMRFEDLIVNSESSMRTLCEPLGIEYDSALIVPTIGGKAWLGNSSTGPLEGVNPRVLDRWKKDLTKYELGFIEEQCGSLMETLGYRGHKIDHIQVDVEHVVIPVLQAKFRLDPIDNLSRLREESRRMSILFHYIYNDSIMRVLCGRYTEKTNIGVRSLRRLLPKSFWYWQE